MYTYKHLSSSDLGLLRELNKMFAEVFEEPGTYQGAPPSDEYLLSLLGKPHVMLLVAMDGNEVVGGLAAYELEKFEQERTEVYIYDLGVQERHRRQGIATRLINELRHIAKERGAWVVFVQADYEDDPAIRLYESLGKREEVLHFDIAVDV
ncbi:MAG: AAC(3)-I family aminoglycoside N-acetyltransferase [Dehalococcoidia bacterium]